jgi:GH43 family beta-xylosidase
MAKAKILWLLTFLLFVSSIAFAAPSEAVSSSSVRFEAHNYPGYYWRHMDFSLKLNNSISPIQDSQFRPVAGLANSNAGYVSFESVNYPGYYLRHVNYKMVLSANDGTSTLKQDATFKRVAGLGDASKYSYQSYNYPSRYIRHINYGLEITPIASTLDKQDATFSERTMLANNPALPGFTADPKVAVFNGLYYIYPTIDGYAGWSSTQFKAYSSPDLVNWTDHGVILDLASVSWGKTNAWAPTITERNGKYYYYFVASGQIGVAVSDSPTGPFKDALGKPLIATGQYNTNPIDPEVFVDDGGQAYLYFGNTSLWVVKLKSDMVTIDGPATNITPANFREGVTMFKRNGKYYLMWSEDDTRSENYRVSYAIGNSPTGPFSTAANNPVLSKDLSLGIKGTGHHSILKIPSRDEYYIVYHRFAIPGGDGYHREVCIDRMYFNADGTIQKVKPTLEGIQTPVKM